MGFNDAFDVESMGMLWCNGDVNREPNSLCSVWCDDAIEEMSDVSTAFCKFEKGLLIPKDWM